MTVLVVDDERTLDIPDVLHLRTSEEALRCLRVYHAAAHINGIGVDAMYLDHDLGGDDTTRPVVVWLEEHACTGDRFNVDEIVVHTANTVGAKWIMAGLSCWYPVRRMELAELAALSL